jgi:tetratricopeptide (TPR) repeat protein
MRLLRKAVWLGVRLADLTSEEAAALGLPEPRGAKMTTATEGGPAIAAGLMVGDVIQALDGIAVADSRSLVEAIGRRPPGTRLEIQYQRGRDAKSVSLVLGSRPRPQAQAPDRASEPPPVTTSKSPVPPTTKQSIEVLSQSVATLYAAGRYAEALEVGIRMLSIAEHTVGVDSPAFAGMLTDLGAINQALGKFAEAERLHLQALAISERALGKEHVALGTTLHNLAVLYTDTGRYAEAERTYKRSLAISEKDVRQHRTRSRVARCCAARR